MLLNKFISIITGFFPPKPAEAMNYEDIFKGSATPLPCTLDKPCFSSLPWSLKQDSDAYFTDIFAGPLA